MEGELKIGKVTDPVWLGKLGPEIKTFAEKLNLPTITYETLFTYFANTVQFGESAGDKIQFWMVYQDDGGFTPVAFAHWFVCGLPHRGVVFADFIYSWNRMREPVVMLLDKFVKFGIENHAPIYKGTAINETVFRVFRKAASKRQANGARTSRTSIG